MSSLRTNQPSYPNRIYPEPFFPQIDHFNGIPDSLLLLVFNKIGDVKALGRCCIVSCRFHSRGPFWNLFRLVFGGIAKPIQTIGQFLSPKRDSGSNSGNSSSSPLVVGSEDDGDGGVTHHSPTQVLVQLSSNTKVVNEPTDAHCPVVEMTTRSKLSFFSWNKYAKNQIASSDYEGIVTIWDVTCNTLLKPHNLKINNSTSK